MLKDLVQVLVALGPLGALGLAFLDSAGIPVASGMDALLILLALKSPQSAWISAAFAIAGSVVGNWVLFSAARKGGKRFLDREAKPGRAQRFRAWFERYGMITVFIPAFLPIPMPLKLFVVSAGALGTPVSVFLSVVVAARVLHYCGVVWLALILGQQSVPFLKAHVLHFLGGAALLFVLLYVLVRMSDKTRRALRSPEGVPAGPASDSEYSGSKLN